MDFLEKNKKNKLIFNHDKFSVSKKCFKRFTWRQQNMEVISCVYGEIFFVVVNYDKKSKNFGKHKSFKLSHKNNQQILVPPNYLNGFLCLSENCVLHYKLSYKEAILIMINKYQKSGAIKILI